MSAATDAIGAHHFSIPGANCQYCSGRGTPLPYNGWCSRYIAANDKAAGDPPAAAAAAQQPTPNRMHRIVRIALQSKSWIQNMGNLLLWIRLARTGQMISGLLLFCSHRNFHFFFTSHTTFNLHFFAMVSAKMCHRQRKNPCPQDKGCFLVTRTGLEPMLPP